VDSEVLEVLKEIRDATNRRLDELAAQMDVGFGQMNGRLERVDARLGCLDGRLDSADGRLARVDGRLERVDARLSGMDARLSRLAVLLDITNMRMEALEHRFVRGFGTAKRTSGSRAEVDEKRRR
jgi:chromosome segregation ATPase